MSFPQLRARRLRRTETLRAMVRGVVVALERLFDDCDFVARTLASMGGERVVTDGQMRLVSGARVDVKPAGPAGQK